ncbi:MAG: carboxypeptidase regulatory-like domain-containing protein [Acidobacteria bacterium]|nr:carboxypeptidase regulatory-like domain-containing protein [Acidobacteriota bacterium]
MRPLLLALTALVLTGPAASAQEATSEGPVAVEVVSQAEPAAEPARQAVPRGSRPQGDNPQTGTAVPRRGRSAPPPSAAPPPPPDGSRAVSRSRRTIIVRPPAAYGYPYSRYSPYPYSGYYSGYYPYGYGSFGLGFLYYDPYRWHPGAYAGSGYGGYGYGGYGYGGYGYGGYGYGSSFSTFDIGELRLDVSPRHAQVFVDGYYAGIVDDFDGAFQGIRLAPGAYRIDITAPGFETLTFDVRIAPGQKVRYRGDLYRRP